MKVVFMGTAEFAVPSLEALHGAGHKVSLVVCQPDRPSGRGMQLKAPPLKEAALRLGLEVFQPVKVKEAAALERLKAEAPDYLCVVAYGQILPQALLDLPAKMALNVHASLLPKYRGAAPIEWAVAKGETESGVCVQKMALKMDAGPLINSAKVEIGADETAPELTKRLAPIGAGILVEALASSQAPREQDEAAATYAPLLKKSDGAADFNLAAPEFYARFRGFVGRPGFYVGFGGEALRVHKARLGNGSGAPGKLLGIGEGGLALACSKGSILLEEVQAQGGRRMGAGEWARGRRLADDAVFVTPALGG